MFSKIIKFIKFYILKCLTTPVLIALGVVLSVYLIFYPQISFVYSVINMVVYVEPQSDEKIYEKSVKKIVENLNPETEIVYPKYGEKFAELTINSVGMKDVTVFNCDDYAELKYGWGRSFFTRFPGEGGKIVLAGHLSKYRELQKVKKDDKISLKTSYGTFVYKVTQTKSVSENDTTILKPDDSKERLLLYICYGYGSFGRATQRFMVYSDLISGPNVKNIPFKNK